MNAARPSHVARAFTLIELIVVIVVLAILSGVAIPKYFDYAANAKASATKGILGGIRSAIANAYANSAVAGNAAYPTLANLKTFGGPNSVLQEAIPANPYKTGVLPTEAVDVAAGSYTVGSTPAVAGNQGWAYDVSNGHFWANSSANGENSW